MDATNRFADRVADYVRYRPGYPIEVLDALRAEGALTDSSIIADVGSGTGLSAKLFLAAGHTVYGVEPNRPMREAAESLLANEPRFHSVAGLAEATSLPNASIDLVVAGQAFHWFDSPKARIEFQRILRPGGFAALIWNTRRVDATPFLREYERVLHQFGTDYAAVVHTNIDWAAIEAFFGGPVQRTVLANEQRFDRDGVRGRTRSNSYVPKPNEPNFEPMMAELDRLFAEHQEDGVVRFLYDTEVSVGKFA